MLFLLTACGPDIHALYEEQRIAALTVASSVESPWAPDLVFAIGGGALAKAVDAAATAALIEKAKPLSLELPLGTSAKLVPSLKVRRAVLSPADACESCLHFDIEVEGRVDWTLGALGGSFPAGVEVGGAIELGVENGTRVVARPYRVGKVVMKSQDLGGLRANPSSIVQDFVRKAVGEALPPIPLVDLAATGLPIRDMRLRTDRDTARIEVLTNVPGARPATVGVPETDMILLGISETALAGLLRRSAFEQGPVYLDTAIDPQAISVEGNSFKLNLRLWRLVGTGWWRDYDINGSLAVIDNQLSLTPTTVVETGQSAGAELVDPLAALFETQILAGIAESLQQSLPAATKQNVAGVGLKAIAREVRGEAGTLVIEGEVKVITGKE